MISCFGFLQAWWLGRHHLSPLSLQARGLGHIVVTLLNFVGSNISSIALEKMRLSEPGSWAHLRKKRGEEKGSGNK